MKSCIFIIILVMLDSHSATVGFWSHLTSHVLKIFTLVCYAGVSSQIYITATILVIYCYYYIPFIISQGFLDEGKVNTYV